MGPRVRARLPDAVSHPIIIPYVCVHVCVCGGGGGGGGGEWGGRNCSLGTKLMKS